MVPSTTLAGSDGNSSAGYGVLHGLREHTAQAQAQAATANTNAMEGVDGEYDLPKKHAVSPHDRGPESEGSGTAFGFGSTTDGDDVYDVPRNDRTRAHQSRALGQDYAAVPLMFCDPATLVEGEEVEEAPTREMLENPQEDYTKSLWAVRSFQRPQKSRPKDAVPLISVRNVDAAYSGGVKVLDDVSFDIYEGMTVAVVGESGSGKSTTARVITGLLPPSKGEVLFKGEPFPPSYKDRTKDQLRQCQMIYQMADTALNPKLRISELIGRPAQFYGGLKGVALKNRVDALLDMIELEPSQYYNRYPTELSGGQKQRIGIARALAAEPTFIICDEVTSALDQLVAEGILRLLDRLQKELGLAYMFITHDLATVRSIADEVVVMQHGKVVEQGPKDEMFTPPHHPYTDLLLSSVPEMDPNWLTTLLEERGVDNVGDAASARIDPNDPKITGASA